MPIPVRSMPLARRAFLAFAVLLTPLLLAAPAAATPAENFVNDNIQKGLEILRDKKLTTAQRRDQFKALLLGLVDTRRIAVYTLGQYRNSASPADVDAFITACRDTHKLPVVGLMCIPPVDEEPALHFALLAKIAARNGLAKVSMGMSADYEAAVRLGATHVRVGSALFGARPPLEAPSPKADA